MTTFLRTVRVSHTVWVLLMDLTYHLLHPNCFTLTTLIVNAVIPIFYKALLIRGTSCETCSLNCQGASMTPGCLGCPHCGRWQAGATFSQLTPGDISAVIASEYTLSNSAYFVARLASENHSQTRDGWQTSLFNQKFSQAQVVVEHAFGWLKGRRRPIKKTSVTLNWWRAWCRFVLLFITCVKIMERHSALHGMCLEPKQSQ